MVNYLDRIGAGYVIDNPEPLDFDYVPEKLVSREKFQNLLAARFASIDKPDSSCRAIITGPVGSGKLFVNGRRETHGVPAEERFQGRTGPKGPREPQ